MPSRVISPPFNGCFACCSPTFRVLCISPPSPKHTTNLHRMSAAVWLQCSVSLC